MLSSHNPWRRFALLALLTVTIALSMDAAAQPFPTYGEPNRPGFHFSPQRNWTNEPNGLIHHNGRYHMFYQENPFNNQFGNQSWGHAVSTDLVNWEQRPTAIPYEDGVFSFSGSAVYDQNNTSGLGTGGDGPLVAVYTGWTPALNGRQDQRLAFSNDSGDTWTKFSGNPVLDIGSNEFRDPKVFWHDDTQMWKMVTSHGGQRKVNFYESPDLQDWTFKSSFSAPAQTGINGWEVPDMFQVPVDGNPNNKKWVLSITPDSGSPAGGNGVMYFVGDFDGSSFTSNNPPSSTLWADYGRDFDGQQSWANMPDDRTVWTSIMQSYGEHVPTSPWRGQMAFPREVTLETTSNGVRLKQTPIAEIANQRIEGAETLLSNVTVAPGSDPLAGLNLQHDMFELIATFDPADSFSFGFSVREGANGDTTRIGWQADQMYMDRRASGDLSFDAGAGGLHFAPLPQDNGLVKFHALVDRNSVEFFGNDGESVISNLIFPDGSSQGISAFSFGGNATLQSLEIYPLASIWTEQPAKVGTNAIAHWRMDATPRGEVGLQLNPVSIDSRQAFGEGTQLGTGNSLFEPNPAVENLYMFNQDDAGMATSGVVAPSSMFAFGKDGGASSYDAAALNNRGGALFMPADLYGNDLAFDDGFSIEMFFKTDGNQSGAGLMQLLNQGENRFRYGLIVNEGGQGNVRFALNDDAGTIPIADIHSVSSRNYADGEWHYLQAVYDPTEGANGSLVLSIANEDGSFDTVTVPVAGSFQGLPSGGDGNLIIGRNTFANGGDARTFLGLIDEVQLTDGLVYAMNRLGRQVINQQGDFDGNGEYACADIDALVAEIASGGSDASFDLTGDGAVTIADVDAWLLEAGAVELASGASYLQGDANLDGTVDGSDFLIWNSNKFQEVAAWCAGDFNADGSVDGSDFLIWNSNKFQSADQLAVPEPSSLVLLWLACLMARDRRNRRASHHSVSSL